MTIEHLRLSQTVEFYLFLLCLISIQSYYLISIHIKLLTTELDSSDVMN